MIVLFAIGLYLGVLGVFFAIRMIDQDFDRIQWRFSFDQTNPVLLAKTTEMLKGYPMESMAPYIAQQDPQVAAFLIAIGKKESAWGKRAPKLNGRDCYNYWGFRQKRARMGSGGHTCFDSPSEAVKVVSDRIEDLIKKKYDTPREMIVWKCGFSCSGHSSTSVQKWIQDVDYYYNMVYREEL